MAGWGLSAPPARLHPPPRPRHRAALPAAPCTPGEKPQTTTSGSRGPRIVPILIFCDYSPHLYLRDVTAWHSSPAAAGPNRARLEQPRRVDRGHQDHRGWVGLPGDSPPTGMQPTTAALHGCCSAHLPRCSPPPGAQGRRGVRGETQEEREASPAGGPQGTGPVRGRLCTPLLQAPSAQQACPSPGPLPTRQTQGSGALSWATRVV